MKSALDAVRAWERLEDPPRLLGTPFLPEHDLAHLCALRGPELRAELESLAAARGPEELARRGRLRRLLGDPAGAALDLRAALDAEPGNGRARAWLAELDLRSPAAAGELSKALEDGAPEWARLYLCAALLHAGRGAEALKEARRLAKAEPASALGRLLLGLAEERAGTRSAAARAYAAAGRLDPGCAAAPLLESRARGDSPAALELVEKALTAEPTYALITLSWHRPGRSWRGHLARLRRFAFAEPDRAGWYYRQEDIRYSPYPLRELADSEALLALRPQAPWALALVARGALRSPKDQARQERGLACVERAIARAPRSGWLRAWRGLALIKAGRLQEAERSFTESIALQPMYHRGYAWRGALRRRLDDLSGSLDDLDRAVAVDELYAFARHERSLTRRAVGDWAGAAADLDAAFRLDWRYEWAFAIGREPSRQELDDSARSLDAARSALPSCVSLLCWRGQLELRRGDASSAVRLLEACVHADPQHALGWAWLGRARLEARDPRGAQEALSRAVALEPGLWIAYGWSAEALAAAGRSKEAFAVLDRAQLLKPTLWWVHQSRARLLVDAGKPRAALAEIDACLALEGRHADSWHVRAEALLALGRPAQALESVELALAVSPNLGRGYALRAEARRRLGRHDAALADYRLLRERFSYLFNAGELARVEELLR